MKRHCSIPAMILCVMMICAAFASCSGSDDKGGISAKGLATQHESEFGGIYIMITIDEFNGLGFSYGDSVDIIFSNGYTLEDIPYYNGYYVDAGEVLLVAYPGYDYIKAAVNYGEDLWETGGLQAMPRTDLWAAAGIEEHTTATVILKEKGKYADVQTARDLSYSDDRNEYPSDEAFANFRMITVGDISPGVLYRSASPCDNQHCRAPYVDELIETAGIACILDLADSFLKIDGYIQTEGFSSDYFLSLYRDGKVIPLALTMNYSSADFRDKIAYGLTELSRMDGPYLIHCTEGKDRTGFVCMLLEALAGADYRQIADDYMITYQNYYRISRTQDSDKYDVILENNLDAMLYHMIGDGTVDLADADLARYAREYLIGCGMTEDDIDALLRRITQ